MVRVDRSKDVAAVAAARSAACLFRTDSRGILEVLGSDRVRWLDGMISGDVGRLETAGPGSGCYAMLLTNRGKIVADLHVGRIGEGFVLECRADRIPTIRETLDRFIIADDVELRDRTPDFEGIGLEGPLSAEILEDATGLPAGEIAGLARENWRGAEIAGQPVRIGAFGWSGEVAYQLFVSREGAAAVAAELEKRGSTRGLVEGEASALEILRVEAGIPALGPELSDDVLPPEARLERAIAVNKGCYVGQEIVARLRARGQVNHLLVGLRISQAGGGSAEPASLIGESLSVGDRRTGEITSVVDSPTLGTIALGFVRREHSEPGTPLAIAHGQAVVEALPFVSVGAAAADSSDSP